jgi:DNA (cytosine-5)-methyltransferase 1
MEKIKFIDLCAGIGGFHLALNAIGAKCVYASEINEHARNTYLLCM